LDLDHLMPHLNQTGRVTTTSQGPGVPPHQLGSTLHFLPRLLRLLLWRWLCRRQVDSLVREWDLVGQTGLVLLACSRTQRGLVRLTARGCLIDVPAYGTDIQRLLRGDRVLVLHHQDHQLWVTDLKAADPEEFPSPQAP
jgi:hypothetical protein